MYALVSLWQLPQDPEGGFPPVVVHHAREAPGFLAGYWTYERANGKSFGFLVLDSAEHAHDLKHAIERDVEERDQRGVQLEMLRVQEIVERAEMVKVPG